MSPISDSAILKKIAAQPKRSAGFKQLVRELGVHGEARRELSHQLDRLVAKGELSKMDSDRFAIPQPTTGKNMVVGRLTMHRDGYGFVIPDTASLEPRLKQQLTADIFIPPPSIGSAMHGDRVLVQVRPRNGQSG